MGMRVHCSHCKKTGVIHSQRYDYAPLETKKCPWCSGKGIIEYERFQAQVKLGRPLDFSALGDIPFPKTDLTGFLADYVDVFGEPDGQDS